MLIDTHCHIDRYPDPLRLARECETRRIVTVAVTQLPSHYEMAQRHIGSMQYVKPALGFHPLAVAKNVRELSTFISLLKESQFVGEVGLDYSKDGIASKEQQLVVFRAIAEALSASTRFITVHSRRATVDVTEILQKAGVRNTVFHWFTGSVSALDAVIEAGHYLSINTAMLTTKKGSSLLQRIPRDRVLTETDGPYVKIGRRAAKPNDVIDVLHGIADAWGVPKHEAEAIVTGNFQAICASVGVSLSQVQHKGSGSYHEAHRQRAQEHDSDHRFRE